MSNGKIIIIDASIIAHKCIFNWNNMNKLKKEGKLKSDFILGTDYSYFATILGYLKKIVVKKEDIIIVGLDAKNSWRRAFYSPYKAQRKEFRDSFEDIDWGFHYNKIEQMNQKLNNATNWHFIKISDFTTHDDLMQFPIIKNLITSHNDDTNVKYGIEFDDIAATACRVFENKECVIVTRDADLDMLVDLGNVKIFSTNIKCKGGKGAYKIVNDPLKLLANKIRKGDVSDNILVSDSDTEQDIKIRQLIVNLKDLPSFVTEPIEEVLKNLKPKIMKYNELPFQNSLGKPERFNKIYSLDDEITWEDSIKVHEKTLKLKTEKSKARYAEQKKQKLLKKENSLR